MTPPFVKRYLIALDRYKWLGLAGFVVVVGISGAVAIQPADPPTYEASGKLVYSPPPVTFSQTGTEIQQQAQMIPEEVLLSDNLVGAIAERLNLSPLQLAKTVRIKREDNVLTLRYVDGNPQRGTLVVDRLMEGMVEQSRMLNSARQRSILEEINRRLPAVTQELREAEDRLQEYDRREGPALLAAQSGSLVEYITGMRSQQQQIQINLNAVEARINNLQGKLGLTPDQAYASSALSADPIIADARAKLYQAEAQMQLLGQSLRPEHPQMVALQQQREAYEAVLRDRASEVISGNGEAAPLAAGTQIRQSSSLDPARQSLANQLVALQSEREALQQQLITSRGLEEQYRRELENIPNKQLERARLEQQVGLKRTLYDQIQAKLVDAQAAQAEAVGSLSIASPARITNENRSESNPLITLLIGGVVGILVGGGVIFLLNVLEGRFYTLEEVREALRQRDVAVLGLLPLLEAEEPGMLPVAIALDSPYLEFYERFRSNLRRAGETPPKLVLFTSALDGEGKTVTAYNLAIASAHAGKRTLIIEADLRSPSEAKALQVAPDPDSTVEPLRYYGQIGDCIRLVPEVENLYVIPSPGPQRQAAAILESSEMRRLIDDVRGRFDLVVIDTPSLSRCNDALLLEPFTDGIVLVTRPGYTQDSLMGAAIDEFVESDLNLLGGVIAGADIAVTLPLPTHDSPPEEEEAMPLEDFEPHPSDREEVGSAPRS